MRITSLKHQLNIRTTDEFCEKYSENSFLKHLKPTSHSYRVQSTNMNRKSIEWFLFWNNIDQKCVKYLIINHELHGFSNILQSTKNLKNPAYWLAKYIFAYKGNCGASSLNTQKSTHWWINFFQNPFCSFISEHFWASLTKPTILSTDIGNLLF